jgi:hypothetical protein
VETTDTLGSVGQPNASAEELTKQLRKESRQRFLDGKRDSLERIRQQMAFSPAEAGIVCGKSPTWSYRKIYDGTFKVINAEDGRLLIPRSEIERYLGGASKYAPQPKAKIGGGGSEGS